MNKRIRGTGFVLSLPNAASIKGPIFNQPPEAKPEDLLDPKKIRWGYFSKKRLL